MFYKETVLDLWGEERFVKTKGRCKEPKGNCCNAIDRKEQILETVRKK
jgi:hypothetical protein